MGFDMIGPDGTVFPNHHRYVEVRPEERIAYTLLWGENGPKHADAWASFEDQDGATKVVLGMVFSTEAEFQQARGFGAVELGQQTLGNWNASPRRYRCALCRQLHVRRSRYWLLSRPALIFKAALRVRIVLQVPLSFSPTMRLSRMTEPLAISISHATEPSFRLAFPRKGAFLHSLTSRSRDINSKCPGGFVESEIEHLRVPLEPANSQLRYVGAAKAIEPEKAGQQRQIRFL
ncbi:SRPBCC domain-containing protein [Ensifer psoraleae]|uniref:SRPBCC domain-containing protein n=1 Tax=Sinorhizobium psoraleae TaxID=520838 RepID=A0ABT4K9E0_9HYPH|nr:SRPBCC domain-containing protein [Sinorhizobium psoraleae]